MQPHTPDTLRQQPGHVSSTRSDMGPSVKSDVGATPIVKSDVGATPSVQSDVGATPSVQSDVGATPSVQSDVGATPSMVTKGESSVSPSSPIVSHTFVYMR